jgi:diguanylate cyclase (GGDEF)-like protein
MLPVVTAPLAGLFLAYAWFVPNLGVPGRAIEIGSLALILLAALRQMFGIWESTRLYDCAGSAYRELERTHAQTTGHASRIAELNNRLRLVQEELIHNNHALSEANTRLADLATTDGMTGLANHRALQERLRAEIAAAEEEQRCVSLLMMDVDNFKQYNDHFGHPAGDDVLRVVSQHIRNGTTGAQFAARYGGEEFALLLPDMNAAEAGEIAESIRESIASHQFPYRRVSVSIGVAQFPADASEAKSLIKRADSALYVAKHSGKNRVAHAGDVALVQPECEPSATRIETIFQVAFADGAVASDQRLVDNIVGQDTSGLISALMGALDLRDEETEDHSRRVAIYALRLARAASEAGIVDLDDTALRGLGIGALLHDIGKIGIPDSILFKRGPLTAEQIRQMQQHPELGARLLHAVPALVGAVPVVLHHHERWDGNGYPYGLSGNQIPIMARIFAISDTLDAMTSDRPYRPRLPFSEALAEVHRLAGSQFDPELANLFLSIPECEWRRLRNGISPNLSDLANPPFEAPKAA